MNRKKLNIAVRCSRLGDMGTVSAQDVIFNKLFSYHYQNRILVSNEFLKALRSAGAPDSTFLVYTVYQNGECCP